ncbi:UDP-N-acetylmuramoyl-L-alanyl-D-glutamate--2,6-diaminopimelate ligase [Longispora albida]|uniref:UDP-N-acetylmuramoyl-L-alanyl-D-glutamate--2, 6-diaminopimelate ligase n=1 Tax=Longispora albida TaxID=203523 RepID=UPI000376A46B|nr:UDP-N-acetylmuramoyl-L-alanyl-D-glutamate--2,6-diaminopimelate ligase [Longispora albida]
MDLAGIAAVLGLTAPAGVAVSGVTLASGEVRPGDLYAALPGANRHGAEFAAQAREAGAVAVLTDPAGAERAGDLPVLVVEDPRAVLGAVSSFVYGDPSSELIMLGVTGTAGKTSTAYLLESGLRAAGHVTGMVGSVETRLGEEVVESTRTTPEAPALQGLLGRAVELGVTAVAMEVSSHALKLGRVEGVRYKVAGYTNFGMDHLDLHHTVEDYFASKARLFDGRSERAVLNYDDPALRPLVTDGTVTYSAAGDAAATWYATDISGTGYEQKFTANGPAGAVQAGVRLPGRHNISNALLAIAMLTEAGVDPVVAAAGVAACAGVAGRLECVAERPVLGVVDYAHKPDAIRAALAALREVTEGRLICVIGAGGDRDRAKRPVMGEAAATGSDVVIVTDDNPRGEDPAVIRAEVIAGISGSCVEVPGRRAAIEEAVRIARPGDTIALLGKGHERGQEVAGEILPFDDRIELAAALQARSGGAQ